MEIEARCSAFFYIYMSKVDNVDSRDEIPVANGYTGNVRMRPSNKNVFLTSSAHQAFFSCITSTFNGGVHDWSASWR